MDPKQDGLRQRFFCQYSTSRIIHRRFRSNFRGRIAFISLAAIHDNLADPWARAAVALKEAGRLNAEDARRLCWLDAFGALIANTDRHQYNVLFFPEGARLHLAPAFDQVSMLYAPMGAGQVPARQFTLPHATAHTLDVWEEARDAAHQFWALGSEDMRLSKRRSVNLRRKREAIYGISPNLKASSLLCAGVYL
jgi:hypothetical protein